MSTARGPSVGSGPPSCLADDFLEGVEDSEDEAAPGDYDNLAAAMRANAGSIEDSGDEDHAAIAELSDASADAGASPDTDDDDMSQEPFEDSDTGAEFLEGEDGTSDGEHTSLSNLLPLG